MEHQFEVREYNMRVGAHVSSSECPRVACEQALWPLTTHRGMVVSSSSPFLAPSPPSSRKSAWT